MADLYLGEFMRLFDHFRARTYGQDASERGNHLAPDESWTVPYFKSGYSKARQREIFA